MSFQAQQWQRGQSPGAPAASTSPSPRIRLPHHRRPCRCPKHSRLNDALHPQNARAAINPSKRSACLRGVKKKCHGTAKIIKKEEIHLLFFTSLSPLFARVSPSFFTSFPFLRYPFCRCPPTAATRAHTHTHSHTHTENIYLNMYLFYMYSISPISLFTSLPPSFLSSLTHTLSSSPSFPVLLLKFSICAPSPSNRQPPSLPLYLSRFLLSPPPPSIFGDTCWMLNLAVRNKINKRMDALYHPLPPLPGSSGPLHPSPFHCLAYHNAI